MSDTAPRLMLGGNVFGWTADRAKSFAVLDAFVDGGGQWIDTADLYSKWVPGHEGGESERMLGDWIKTSGKRDKVKIATKMGGLPGEGGKGLQGTRVAAACDESLARMGIDRIDLYFAHMDDPETPQEETLGAFDALVKAGKVGAIGASNFTSERLSSALAASDANGFVRYSVLEPHYNLLERDKFEGRLQELCLAERIVTVPYYALASGYLTGKYRTEADLGPGGRSMIAGKYLKSEKGPRVLAALDQVAAETGRSQAAVAIAWLADRDTVMAPIASATSPDQLADLLDGATLQLTSAQTETLDKASA